MQPEPKNPFKSASLVGQFAIRTCAKGMHLISRGDSRQTVYYVLKGTFGATMYSQQGKKLSLGRMERGDAFGELSAIDGLGRAVTVEALTDAEVMCIERNAFLSVVMSDPAYTLWLLERVTKRLRQMTDKVFELSVMSVRQCLLAELCREAGGTEPVGDDGFILMPTHSELASRIGTNRETVTREIANLQRNDAIETKGRSFKILKDDQIQHAW